MIYTFKIKIDKEIKIKANEEENAWEKLSEDFINTEEFEDDIEMVDVDDSDEYEAEQRAKARYEAKLEDEYMDYRLE